MRTTVSPQTCVPDWDRRIRSAADAVAPLNHLAERSVNLTAKELLRFQRDGREYVIPRYLFLGARGGAEPIRVGFFAGAFGNEPEGTFALVDFVQALEAEPALATDYCLFIYPILNPTGFETGNRLTAGGTNLPRELWHNSLSPEVQALQSELWMHAFDGMISLHTDSTAQEITVAIGGPAFFRHILGSALPAAQDFLPQTIHHHRDALPPWKSVLLDRPLEIIRAAPGIKPRPFEIVVTLPRQAPLYLQKAAVLLLLRSILAEYRFFIAFGANL